MKSMKISAFHCCFSFLLSPFEAKVFFFEKKKIFFQPS